MSTTRKMLISMLGIVGSCWVHQAVAGCSAEPTLGAICFTAANFCPRGYQKAYGQKLSVTSNESLYSLLGSNYGGNGRTDFGVPDLRGRSVVGAPSSRFIGQRAGWQYIQLTQRNILPHTHNLNVSSIAQLAGTIIVSSAGANQDNPVGHYLANLAPLNPSKPQNIYPYREVGTETLMLSNMVTGQFASAQTITSGVPSENVKIEGPRLVLTACVATTGLYPQRN